MKYALLISPWESASAHWELVLGTEAELLEIVKQRDLTKDYFVVPIDRIAAVLTEWWDKQEEQEEQEQSPVCESSYGRFYVDERVGCIAVRDREKTDTDYPGLHSDTNGVVGYWHGESKQEKCPQCSSTKSHLVVRDEDRRAAIALALKLNKDAVDETNS